MTLYGTNGIVLCTLYTLVANTGYKQTGIIHLQLAVFVRHNVRIVNFSIWDYNFTKLTYSDHIVTEHLIAVINWSNVIIILLISLFGFLGQCHKLLPDSAASHVL